MAPPLRRRGVVVWYPRSRPTRAQSSEAGWLGCQCPYASFAVAPRVERRENCRSFHSVFVSRRVHTSSDARADSNYVPGSKAVGSPPCRGGTRAVAQPSLPLRHGSAGPPGSCGSGPPPPPRLWSQGAADYGSRQASRWPLSPWRRGLWAPSASGLRRCAAQLSTWQVGWLRAVWLAGWPPHTLRPQPTD